MSPPLSFRKPASYHTDRGMEKPSRMGEGRLEFRKPEAGLVWTEEGKEKNKFGPQCKDRQGGLRYPKSIFQASWFLHSFFHSSEG